MRNQSIVEELKWQFRYGGIIQKLMFINIGVFLIISIMKIGLFLIGLGQSSILKDFIGLIAVPLTPLETLYRPYTFISYMFVHEGFFHILFNMLNLYYFGRILADLGGPKKVLPIYLLGGIIGAIFSILTLNLLPAYSNVIFSGNMIGASASVLAIAAAAATLSPTYSIQIFFVGRIQLRYLVLIFIFLDLLALPTYGNSGGHLAHLGGALTGYLLIKGLQKRGTQIDFISPLNRFFDWIMNIFKPKPKFSMHKTRRPSAAQKASNMSNAKPQDTQTEAKLNAILDKIKEGGYESLSASEKAFLNAYGK